MNKAYKVPVYKKSALRGKQSLEGETIEHKIERIVTNKEPITDGAPEIFTERKDGVNPAYNIRTDRWEIAAEAMDSIAGSLQAKREEKAKAEAEAEKVKVIDINGKEGATGTEGEGKA